MLRTDDRFSGPSAVARLGALAAYGILDTPAEKEFDDLAHMAAELCGTPVALVSFVDVDRQWFKARVGFDACETDLQSSVCRFVLNEPDVLVIPDLRLDERTADNPLVTGEPHIRFYAGAPLRTQDGYVLGSLCVIDTAPRAQGLSERQAENLRRIAGQVMAQLDLKRMVARRDAALLRSEKTSNALALSEAHWRGLFDTLQEGFAVGQPVRDASGRLVDWRHIEVNRAWSDLIGADSRAILGWTIRDILPGVEQAWIDLASVVDSGEVKIFTQPIEQLGRWYEGRANALGPELFAVLLLDVTERVKTARAVAESTTKKLALAELADCLRASHDVAAMSHVSSAIAARTLGAIRAGYGVVGPSEEAVDVISDWRASGVATVAGRHEFRTYGSYIDDLKRGLSVVVDDIWADPRTRDGADALSALGVAAFIDMPVMEHGKLVGLSFLHFDHTKVFSPEEQAFVHAVADRTQVGIARLKAEERQSILNGEISHRLKNILAMVQSVAAQTLRGRAEPEAMKDFDQRLAALSKSQDVLLQAEWQAADLETVVREVLNLTGSEGRYDAVGPAVRLGPRATLSVSLLIHELDTNAQKYGALRRAEGRIRVEWRLEGDGDKAELVLDWREEGGPPAVPPTRNGFGSRLIRLGLAGTGGATLNFDEGGFSASFRTPMRQVVQA